MTSTHFLNLHGPLQGPGWIKTQLPTSFLQWTLSWPGVIDRAFHMLPTARRCFIGLFVELHYNAEKGRTSHGHGETAKGCALWAAVGRLCQPFIPPWARSQACRSPCLRAIANAALQPGAADCFCLLRYAEWFHQNAGADSSPRHAVALPQPPGTVLSNRLGFARSRCSISQARESRCSAPGGGG